VTLSLFVSAEAAMGAWLAAQPEVVAVVADRIGTTLPEFDPANPTAVRYPAIRVNRVAGFTDRPYRDLPRVRIECWGDDTEENPVARHQMDALARTVAAAIQERGAARTGSVAGLSVVYGPQPLADTDTHRARYLLDVTFSALEESA
jgi:hypothetical protein